MQMKSGTKSNDPSKSLDTQQTLLLHFAQTVPVSWMDSAHQHQNQNKQ